MRLLLHTLLLVTLVHSPLQARQDETRWTELSGATPAQWRVIWTESPSSNATISWSTAVEGAQHSVYLSSAPRSGVLADYEQTVQAQRSGLYTHGPNDAADLPETWYHHARLRGLEPSTTYWFVMVSEGVVSPELHFVTAPVDDRPVKILYGGDSRSDREARCTMNVLMARLVAEDPTILALAHGGDYVFDGRRWQQWTDWLSNHELCVGPKGRVLPIIPGRGNHDIGPIYDEIFDDPGGAAKNYFVTQLGARVALVGLNSEISTAGEQALWMRARLQELRPANHWLVVQYHTPIYPAVKQPGRAKATWAPLFEEFDVDLALESDGHAIKRTVPIRAGLHDPTGVTYIGEGCLGVPPRRPDAKRWYLQAPGMTGSGLHVTLLDFGPEHLRMTTLGPRRPGADPASADEGEGGDYHIYDDHRLPRRERVLAD